MTKWKLVPVDPTPEMVVAGIDTPVIVTEDDKIDQHDDYKRVYASMLEAAPQPPRLSDERILDLLGEVPDGPEDLVIRIARAIDREILGENK